jgi:glyoxylase I family protein
VQSSGVHHIALVVSSIERSLSFYRDLLGPLGWHGLVEVEGERGETIFLLTGPGTAIALREAQTRRFGQYDRYAVGMHHLCFEAFSHADIDERADWLRSIGAELESEPREYGYAPGYYAVYFYDPDGLKLEIAHVPDWAA